MKFINSLWFCQYKNAFKKLYFLLQQKFIRKFHFRLDNKESQQKYQDVILDFSYFKVSDAQEKKINANPVS